MNKSSTNASWNQLTPEAREKIESWLFDDCLTYEETLRRAREEFGFQGSVSSLYRFFARRSQTRALDNLGESLKQAAEINRAEVDTGQIRDAGLKIMAQAFLGQVTHSPENPRQWGWMAKLLLQSEENEIRERIAREDLELRRKAIALSRERFEFNTVEEALNVLPQLKQLAQSRKSPQHGAIESRARFLALRWSLFGKNANDARPDTEKSEDELKVAAEALRILREQSPASPQKTGQNGEQV